MNRKKDIKLCWCYYFYRHRSFTGKWKPKEMGRLRSLYTILTKDDKLWSSDQIKRKRIGASRGNKLWEDRYIWGNKWEVILVRFVCADSSWCQLSVFMPIKLSGEGIHGCLHFSKVSDFKQMREALRRPFSASVDSQLFSVHHNPYAQVAYLGVIYSNPKV